MRVVRFLIVILLLGVVVLIRWSLIFFIIVVIFLVYVLVSCYYGIVYDVYNNFVFISRNVFFDDCIEF